jgi:pimeloyl-ACP methyl ester carboxylesterase
MIKSLLAVHKLLLLALLTSTSVAAKQSDETQMSGKWQGVLSIQGQTIPIIFHISTDDSGNQIASMDSPAQNAKGIPVASVTFEDNQLSIDIAVAQAKFHGTYNPEKNIVNGTWSQGANHFSLDLVRETHPLAGAWIGELDGTTAQLYFEISALKNGEFSASLSPNKGKSKVAATSVIVTENSIEIEIQQEGVSYFAALNSAKNLLEGQFKKGNQSFLLHLQKIETLGSVNRPQAPSLPLPYITQEISFDNSEANITLSGTLSLPSLDKKHPAVVLITGSGPQDRDQSFMGHKTFLVLADYLTRNGIAVLRFDDRGVAQSTGSFDTATSMDFASDVHFAVEFLHTHPNISKQHIGLIGHSEGGLIAPIVASKNAKVSFVALLAGPGLSGNEVAIAQIKTFLRINGLSDATSVAGSELTRSLNNVVLLNKNDGSLKSELHQAYDTAWKAMSEIVRHDLKAIGGGKLTEARVQQLSTDWNRYFLAHEPSEYLSSLSIPVLAIHGDKDTQMDAKTNLKAIEKALAGQGHELNLIESIKGVNHLFQTANSGRMAEYAEIDETIATLVLEMLSNWINKVVGV